MNKGTEPAAKQKLRALGSKVGLRPTRSERTEDGTPGRLPLLS